MSHENKTYLETNVRHIYQQLTLDLLSSKPSSDQIFSFLRKWLDENEARFKPKVKANTDKKAKNNTSESEEDEYIEDLPQKKEVKKVGRSSVSAEVYGLYNKKGDFKPRIIKKSKEQIERIKDRLHKAFMFQCLDEKETDIVVNAMEEKKFKQGDPVIKQGDDGGELYVVDSGNLDCTKKFKPDENPKYLKTYIPGESFGELSLLYNAPRAANIIAKTDSVLFALDRETFNHIVKDAAMKRRERYENFLKKVELLQSMDPYERMQLADGLKNHKFKPGDYVVKQGEEGDTFFMVEEGDLVAMKVLKPGEAAKEVYAYKSGDYFGELALLNNKPRQASILCKSEVKLVSLDRESFKRMLGPIEDILKRNLERYEKFSSN